MASRALRIFYRRLPRSLLRRKVVRYAILGGGIAAIDTVFFITFAIWAELPYLWVNAIGLCISTFINYFLSIRWVFQSGVRYKRRYEMSLVFLISVTALVLNQCLLYLCVSILMVPLFEAKLLTVGSVFFWNYLARKHFVFS